MWVDPAGGFDARPAGFVQRLSVVRLPAAATISATQVESDQTHGDFEQGDSHLIFLCGVDESRVSGGKQYRPDLFRKFQVSSSSSSLAQVFPGCFCGRSRRGAFTIAGARLCDQGVGTSSLWQVPRSSRIPPEP